MWQYDEEKNEKSLGYSRPDCRPLKTLLATSFRVPCLASRLYPTLASKGTKPTRTTTGIRKLERSHEMTQRRSVCRTTEDYNIGFAAMRTQPRQSNCQDDYKSWPNNVFNVSMIRKITMLLRDLLDNTTSFSSGDITVPMRLSASLNRTLSLNPYRREQE